MGMFTVDMGRCPGCGDKDNCQIRKKLAPALSTLTNEINTDSQLVDGPGDGTIIVSCQYRPAA